MRQKTNCAWQHGLKAFIFDWYFYEDGPFLQQPLEEAFLPTADGSHLSFALMWANHNWTDIHPWTVGTPLRTLYPGIISDAAFERLCDYVIEHYLSHPAYWRLDGKAYFSIYNLPMLHDLKRLEQLRLKTELAGFPLHINLIIPKNPILPDELGQPDFLSLVKAGYADSCTLYVWNSHVNMDTFPTFSYARAREQIRIVNQVLTQQLPVPFYPNITVGWDCSPRSDQKTLYEHHGYPYCPVMSSTPEEFGKALSEAMANQPEIVTINAWNEWTEGSYLEPDEDHGFAFLQQLHKATAQQQKKC